MFSISQGVHRERDISSQPCQSHKGFNYYFYSTSVLSQLYFWYLDGTASNKTVSQQEDCYVRDGKHYKGTKISHYQGKHVLNGEKILI